MYIHTMRPVFALTPACRFALPKRALPRAVVVSAKPEPRGEPEPVHDSDDEEELHFVPVPQAVALAILRSFIALLDAINKL